MDARNAQRNTRHVTTHDWLIVSFFGSFFLLYLCCFILMGRRGREKWGGAKWGEGRGSGSVWLIGALLLTYFFCLIDFFNAVFVVELFFFLYFILFWFDVSFPVFVSSAGADAGAVKRTVAMATRTAAIICKNIWPSVHRFFNSIEKNQRKRN